MQQRDFLARIDKTAGAPITDSSYCERLVQKWQPLTEGIENELPPMGRSGDGDYVKTIASFMLEQQANHLKNLAEDTRAMSVGPFMKFVFPVIRRSAVRLVATQIASVQPMTGPIGGVAFYRQQYATNKGGVTAGDEINKSFNRWYSAPYIDGESLGTGDAANLNFNKTMDFTRVEAGSARVTVAGELIATDNGAGGFTNVAGASLALAGGSSLSYQDALCQLSFTTPPAVGAVVRLEYRYDMELNSRIGEVQINIELKAIEAESRKLKSLASVEAADDLRAIWGRDLDADLVATMADEMTAEIDREIVGTALSAVEPIARVTWDRATPSGIDDPAHLRSLVIQMSRASQIIHRRTQRSGANWCITSSEVAALLMNIDGFQSIDDGHVMQGGIVKGGVLMKTWQIFIDPLFPANKILMGYQGPSILDTGIIYSPYIPMEITPNFYDPNDFSIRRAVRTRHKVTMVRPEFFALVHIDNLTN